jgi:hypothetical protein
LRLNAQATVMAGWYVNYYSVTRRAESRTACSMSFDGALIHARALVIHGHIVRSIVGPNGNSFDVQLFQHRIRENPIDRSR